MAQTEVHNGASLTDSLLHCVIINCSSSRGEDTEISSIYPAVDKGDDVIVSNALENVDLAGKILEQLLCHLGTEDRLDGDRFFCHLIDKNEGTLGVNWSID